MRARLLALALVVLVLLGLGALLYDLFGWDGKVERVLARIEPAPPAEEPPAREGFSRVEHTIYKAEAGPLLPVCRWYLPEPLEVVHPLFAEGLVAAAAASLVYDPVFYLSEEAGDWRSRLVETLETDGERVRLYLRGDLQWHDSAPITPEDLCFSIAITREHRPSMVSALGACAVLGGGLGTEPGLERPGVEVTLTREVGDPREVFAFYLLPAHHPKQAEAVRRFGAGVGSGPYKAVVNPNRVMLTASRAVHHGPVAEGLTLMVSDEPLTQISDLSRNHAQAILGITEGEELLVDQAGGFVVETADGDIIAWAPSVEDVVLSPTALFADIDRLVLAP